MQYEYNLNDETQVPKCNRLEACLLGFEIYLASSLSTALLFIIFVSSRNQLQFKAS